MEKEEIRDSLNERIKKAKEREKILSAQRKTMQPKVTIPLAKKSKPSIHEKQEQSRIEYIEDYCLNLLSTGKFSKECVEIIAHCMLEKNIRIDKYLIENVEDKDYHYTVYLIYLMIQSGLFSEDDYYDAGELIINNNFQMREIFEDLIKEKKITI